MRVGKAVSSRLNGSFVRYWLPWYLYLAAIFVSSSLPRPERFWGLEIKDYWLHSAEYFVAALLTFRAFAHSRASWLSAKFFPSGICFSLFYAMTDEFHQLFVPGRSGTLMDVLFDAAGITLAAAVYRLARMRKSDGRLPA
jgi:VanZ family protein